MPACPLCLAQKKTVKCGTFPSRTRRRVQRYLCRACGRRFSEATLALSYREKKPDLNAPVLRMLDSGLSQRRVAELLGLHRVTVARKLVRMGRQARFGVRHQAELVPIGKVAQFDEMETFEHSKMKPLSIALAVEEKSRRILAVELARMPAKGLLAKASRKKYGQRPDQRPVALAALCRELKRSNPNLAAVKTDEAPRYPALVRRHLPGVTHLRFKGRRACVVGQGELKACGKDPLFSLNHTAAMIRDNLKTLSRRTWCTAKRTDRLQYLLYLYAWCHNQRLAGVPIRKIQPPPYAAT